MTPEQHVELNRIEANCRESLTTYSKDALWLISQLKAAHEAAEEFMNTLQESAVNNGRVFGLVFMESGKATLSAIISHHLAPVQAELDSRREESAKLEKLVEALSKAAPNCKGAPDPIDHGTACLAHLVEQIAAKDAENKALRQIIADSVKALKSGVVAPDASLEFMREVPKEVGLVVDGKDKLLKEAREIIDRIGTSACGCEVSVRYQKAQDWLARVKE